MPTTEKLTKLEVKCTLKWRITASYIYLIMTDISKLALCLRVARGHPGDKTCVHINNYMDRGHVEYDRPGAHTYHNQLRQSGNQLQVGHNHLRQSGNQLYVCGRGAALEDCGGCEL